jgi:FMN-dependent NADH-azoreductase
MPKLLVIETSPRGNASISNTLSKRFVSQWLDVNPHGTVTTRDLASEAPPHLTLAWLAAYFTPPPAQTAEMQTQMQLSDALVAELLEADELVIATPVYNYNIPASLKVWIDHVVRKGLTLGNEGQGLVIGKKATVIIASGGIYGEASPIEHLNFAPRYLTSILNVIGITDVTLIHGEGAKAVDLGQASMGDFVDGLIPELGRSTAA